MLWYGIDSLAPFASEVFFNASDAARPEGHSCCVDKEFAVMAHSIDPGTGTVTTGGNRHGHAHGHAQVHTYAYAG